MGLKLSSKEKSNDSIEELGELAKTAGAVVVAEVVQARERPCASTYIGEGKVHELRGKIIDAQADLVIFDNDLTGTQVRNLESIAGARVIDRTELILDIFARRAKTREAKLQVELAQLRYLLPRLTGKGVSLSRLGGGIGTRGPGETKLEYDRRRIRERITHLKRDMESVAKERSQQRAGRRAFVIYAIVGYTNAGKSTLLNTLTTAGVMAEDGLFATLDPTTRSLVLPNNQKILLVDTVGFIQNLPHDLVSSFAATLEEVKEADCLLHVVDASSPWMEKQINEVNKVLSQLEVISKPTLLLLNKIDKTAPFRNEFLTGFEDDHAIDRMLKKIPNSVAISALYGQGLDNLFKAMMDMPPLRLKRLSITIPVDKSRLYAWICEEGDVVSCSYQEDKIIMDVGLTPKKAAIFERLRKNLATDHNG